MHLQLNKFSIITSNINNNDNIAKLLIVTLIWRSLFIRRGSIDDVISTHIGHYLRPRWCHRNNHWIWKKKQLKIFKMPTIKTKLFEFQNSQHNKNDVRYAIIYKKTIDRSCISLSSIKRLKCWRWTRSTEQKQNVEDVAANRLKLRLKKWDDWNA